jgi:hypothetical protein
MTEGGRAGPGRGVATILAPVTSSAQPHRDGDPLRASALRCIGRLLRSSSRQRPLARGSSAVAPLRLPVGPAEDHRVVPNSSRPDAGRCALRWFRISEFPGFAEPERWAASAGLYVGDVSLDWTAHSCAPKRNQIKTVPTSRSAMKGVGTPAGARSNRRRRC